MVGEQIRLNGTMHYGKRNKAENDMGTLIIMLQELLLGEEKTKS